DENTEIELIDEPTEETIDFSGEVNRPELAALENLAAIGKQKINIARSETLPNIALMGGYSWIYPSLFNGFEKKFTGLWNVGVMVKIPIVTWGDRFYKVKAAKAQSVVNELRLEETREKINLQISQSRQKVMEAQQSLDASKSAVEAADENLRFAKLGLKEGVIPVINVNEAQTAWLSAHSQLISSQIDLKLAQLHLKKALGQM
ncbi:MAG: TolC family protein, partial [Muribaculaceae bacterium]|nr:TolC family protein [Muribaculaceae bacterium]